MNGTEKTTTDQQTHNWTDYCSLAGRCRTVYMNLFHCCHGNVHFHRFHIICSHLSQLLVTLWQHRPRPLWKVTNEYMSCASTGIMLTHASMSWYFFTRTHLETSGTSVTPRIRSFREWIHSHAVWSQSSVVPTDDLRLTGGHTDLLHHSNQR